MAILDLVKQLLHIDSADTSLDDILNDYIGMSKYTFYQLTGHYLGITTTRVLTLYPETLGTNYVDSLLFNFAFTSVESVVIDDVPLTTDEYSVNLERYEIIFVKDGYYSPITFTKNITVTFTIGYDSEDNIPVDIQLTIALMTKWYYENLGTENYKVSGDQKLLTPEQIQFPQALLDKIFLYKVDI